MQCKQTFLKVHLKNQCFSHVSIKDDIKNSYQWVKWWLSFQDKEKKKQ